MTHLKRTAVVDLLGVPPLSKIMSPLSKIMRLTDEKANQLLIHCEINLWALAYTDLIESSKRRTALPDRYRWS